MASDQEYKQHLVMRVSTIDDRGPPSSSDGVATRYVANPTLAKLKHLINVHGLGLVRRLVEIIPESQDEITSKHARGMGI